MSNRRLNPVESVGKTEDPTEVKFHIRGREYVIHEMLAEEYEEALRAAAVEGEDGKTDMLVFEKLLAAGSVRIDGEEVDLEQWNKLPYPVTNRILVEVKKVHWVDIETDEEIKAREAAARARKRAEDDGEEKPKEKASDIPNS